MNFSGAYIKLLYSICNFFIKKKNEILQCLKSFLCIIFTKLINLSGAYIKLLYSICNFFLFFFFFNEILQFLKTFFKFLKRSSYFKGGTIHIFWES